MAAVAARSARELGPITKYNNRIPRAIYFNIPLGERWKKGERKFDSAKTNFRFLSAFQSSRGITRIPRRLTSGVN